MEETKADEILKAIKTLSDGQNKMEQKLNEMEQNRIEDNKNIEEKFNKVNQKLNKMEQNRIDDNFYFEQKYYDKISIIFDKLQLNDELKDSEKDETKKLQDQVEKNSANIMQHEFKIARLEKLVKSK